MSKITSGIDAIAGVHRGTKRLARTAATILGVDEAPAQSAAPSSTAITTSPRRDAFKEFLVRSTSGERAIPIDVPDTAGTAVGGAAGMLLWKRHRFLGALGGASVGRNVPALFNARYRRAALCNMGQTTAGVVGSLLVPSAPFIAFGVAWLGAGAAIYLTGLRGTAPPTATATDHK